MKHSVITAVAALLFACSVARTGDVCRYMTVDGEERYVCDWNQSDNGRAEDGWRRFDASGAAMEGWREAQEAKERVKATELRNKQAETDLQIAQLKLRELQRQQAEREKADREKAEREKAEREKQEAPPAKP
jgi:hypothetical protein